LASAVPPSSAPTWNQDIAVESQISSRADRRQLLRNDYRDFELRSSFGRSKKCRMWREFESNFLKTFENPSNLHKEDGVAQKTVAAARA
jgi:hypothetical protein